MVSTEPTALFFNLCVFELPLNPQRQRQKPKQKNRKPLNQNLPKTEQATNCTKPTTHHLNKQRIHHLKWIIHELPIPPESPTAAGNADRLLPQPGFGFWFCVALTLELSGPRQRLRLNDLLYAPLILTLNLCFDLFGTEPAEHHSPVCTAPTTDFCIQPKSAM